MMATPHQPRRNPQGSLVNTLNSMPSPTYFPRSPRPFVEERTPIEGHAPVADLSMSPVQRQKLLETALLRVLLGTRQAHMSGVLAQWRLSLAHILRHTSLQRLQQQSQAQSASLTALRRSLATAVTPRPGPQGLITSTTQAGNKPLLVGGALLVRLSRQSKLLALCTALGLWKLMVHAHTSEAISATAPRALRRAGVQEVALLSLREQLATSVSDAAEKGRQITKLQRQLATEKDRRRVVEAGGRQAQGALSKLQADAGCASARYAELEALRDSESRWIAQGRRGEVEAHLMSGELASEEQSSAHARELVVSCHYALLRGQQEQKRHEEQLKASWRKGFARSAEQQETMAADLRSFAALLARLSSQKKAAAVAKRRVLEGKGEACSSHKSANTPSRMLSQSRGRGVAAEPRGRRGGVPREATSALTVMLSSLVDDEAQSDGAGDEMPEEDRAAREQEMESNAETEADTAEMYPAEMEGGAMTDTEPLKHEDAIVGETPTPAATDELQLTSANPPQPTPLQTSAAPRAASTTTHSRCALRHILRGVLHARLGGAFGRWAGAADLIAERCALLASWGMLDEARTELEQCKAENEKLASMLRTARTKLAAEREAASRRKMGGEAGGAATRQLGLQVQVLQKRLQMEQAARKKHEAGTGAGTRYEAILRQGTAQGPARAAPAATVTATAASNRPASALLPPPPLATQPPPPPPPPPMTASMPRPAQPQVATHPTTMLAPPPSAKDHALSFGWEAEAEYNPPYDYPGEESAAMAATSNETAVRRVRGASDLPWSTPACAYDEGLGHDSDVMAYMCQHAEDNTHIAPGARFWPSQMASCESGWAHEEQLTGFVQPPSGETMGASTPEPSPAPDPRILAARARAAKILAERA